MMPPPMVPGPERGGIRIVLPRPDPELVAAQDLTKDDLVRKLEEGRPARLVPGQLDLGIMYWLPSRWHPIARRRAKRRHRSNTFEMFLEMWEVPILVRGTDLTDIRRVPADPDRTGHS